MADETPQESLERDGSSEAVAESAEAPLAESAQAATEEVAEAASGGAEVVELSAPDTDLAALDDESVDKVESGS